MAPRSKTPEVALIDSPEVKEVFVDHTAGLAYDGGVFIITFSVQRHDHSKDPAAKHRQVAARIALPVHSAKQLADHISQFMSELEKRGLIKSTPQRGPTMQ